MAVIDQVLLLQEKVESAVQKIVELKSENDALRRKCSELTNALSEKTELLNSFTADEEKIELSIKNAISRLDTLENSVISDGKASAEKAPAAETPAPQAAKPAEASNPTPAASAAENQTQTQTTSVETQVSQNETSKENDSIDFSLDLSTDTLSEEENQPEEKFDIF
ncbi:MAG: hypothetical protein KBT21_08330 [Treponema sp.]|nr:hypothetical protein [Candidatus Treponema merdequi]